MVEDTYRDEAERFEIGRREGDGEMVEDTYRDEVEEAETVAVSGDADPRATSPKPAMTRRDFVRKTGLGTAAFIALGPLGLAACSASAGSTTTPAAGSGATTTAALGTTTSAGTAKRVAIDYRTWAHITTLSGYEDNDIIKERFEDEFPQYELNPRLFVYGDYLVSLRTTVPQGEGGHVLALQPGAMISQLAPFLEPLEDLAVEWYGADWEQRAVGGALTALRNSSPNKDTLLALPSQLNILGVQWYNRDLFEQVGVSVPQTYEELVAISAEFKGADIIPVAWGAGDRWQNRDYLITFASQFRPGAFELAEAGEISFTDNAIVQAFRHMEQTIADDIYNSGPFGTSAYPDAMASFWEKRAAMVNTGLHNNNKAPQVPDAYDTWRAFLYPSIPGSPDNGWDSDLPRGVPVGTGPGASRPIVDVAVSHGVVAGLDGPQREAAMTFVAWLGSEEIQAWLAFYRAPTWKTLGIKAGAGATPEYQEMLDWHYTVGEYGERREFTSPEVRDEIERVVEDVMVVNGDLMANLENLDQIAAAAREA